MTCLEPLDEKGLEPLDDVCPQDACKAEGRRSKRTELVQWPRVLMVALKRWKVISMHPFQREKVDAHVGFKLVWPAVHDEPPYVLRSLVVHSGVVGGGHYTAYVRAEDNSWYFCNDQQPPRLAQEVEVLRAQAYLLFYER